MCGYYYIVNILHVPRYDLLQRVSPMGGIHCQHVVNFVTIHWSPQKLWPCRSVSKCFSWSVKVGVWGDIALGGVEGSRALMCQSVKRDESDIGIWNMKLSTKLTSDITAHLLLWQPPLAIWVGIMLFVNFSRWFGDCNLPAFLVSLNLCLFWFVYFARCMLCTMCFFPHCLCVSLFSSLVLYKELEWTRLG